MSEQSNEVSDALLYRKLAQLYVTISGNLPGFNGYEEGDSKLPVATRILEENPLLLHKLLEFQNIPDFPLSVSSIFDIARQTENDTFEYIVVQGANKKLACDDKKNTIVHHAIQILYHSYYKMCIYELFGHLKNTATDAIFKKQMESEILENVSNLNGITHFHIACMTNNVETVKFFLKCKQNINQQINASSDKLPGYTPLHLAARYCALEVIHLLLESGADMYITDPEGMSPMHLLLQWGIMIKDNMNMSKKASYKVFIRDLATVQSAVKLMFERGMQFSDGLNYLHIACSMEDSKEIERLLQLENVDLNCCIEFSSKLWPGYTGLHFAAHFNFETLRLLLERGANIFVEDAKGVTPLDLCLQRYGAEQIHLILHSQPTWAEIQFVDGQTKLVDLVAAMKDQSTYKAFLTSMPNVNTFIPWDAPLWPGCTSLHLSVIFAERTKNIEDLYKQTDYDDYSLTKDYNCSVEEQTLFMQRIEACLRLNADVTVQDAFGLTPVHLAYHLGRLDVVKLLLNNHSNSVNPIDECGLSHLHVACATGKTNLADKLLFGGADVNSPIFPDFKSFASSVKDKRRPIPSHALPVPLGSTPLHIVNPVKAKALIELLVRRGADLYAKDVFGSTPIHKILRTNKLGSTEEFPSFFENLKAVTVSGFTPLLVSAYLNNVDAVKRILEFGVDVEAAVGQGSSYDCVSSEIADSTETLPADLEQFRGYRALHFAVKNRSQEIIKLLLSHGADVLAKGNDGLTPLYIALQDNIKDTVGLLTDVLKCDRALQKRVEEETGVTMLHVACNLADHDLVEEALHRGFDVNARTFKNSPIWPNCTPLHVVEISTISKSLLQVLLDNGADVTMMNGNKKTPIIQFYGGSPYDKDRNEKLDLALAAHRDFNVNPSFKGMTHFHIACARNAVKQVEGFLNHGVDVNACVDYMDEFNGGTSPLHYAVAKNSTEAFDLLMKHGADVQVEDVYGWTPLHEALNFVPGVPFRYRMALCNEIVSAGGDVNAADIFGETPFLKLLDDSRIMIDVVKLFLRHVDQVNVFNPVTGEGLMAAAFYCESYRDNQNLFRPLELIEMFINTTDSLKENMGCNLLHNIASHFVGASEARHVAVIERLMELGCGIDAKNCWGTTPILRAAQFQNYGAIFGLLECGANINITNEKGRTAFTCNLDVEERRNTNLVNSLFMTHINKKKFLGLCVNRKDEEIFAKFAKAGKYFKLNQTSEEQYQADVDRLKLVTIGSSSVTLYNFLSETGAVAAYPHMMHTERQEIDNFFKHNKSQLRREYSNWSALLLLQYRKAQARLELMEPAMESLYRLTASQLEELCLILVLRFLSNEDLNGLIASNVSQEE